MASQFLDNLKKAVEEGNFNSEAAKKIIEINNNADTKNAVDSEESLNKRLEESGIKILSEEETMLLSSEYDKKMNDINKQDEINAQLATLIDIEDIVKASVDDMFSFINELEEKFNPEFFKENPIFRELFLKIKEIKSKYNSIINN
jgi:hypothetical protein